ncbi:hypothetical protein GD494_14600 [Salmonella enterica]|nr:hypothetical protein [Salmonella enterica]
MKSAATIAPCVGQSVTASGTAMPAGSVFVSSDTVFSRYGTTLLTTASPWLFVVASLPAIRTPARRTPCPAAEHGPGLAVWTASPPLQDAATLPGEQSGHSPTTALSVPQPHCADAGLA